jgi:hypothetical protein
MLLAGGYRGVLLLVLLRLLKILRGVLLLRLLLKMLRPRLRCGRGWVLKRLLKKRLLIWKLWLLTCAYSGVLTLRLKVLQNCWMELLLLLLLELLL